MNTTIKIMFLAYALLLTTGVSATTSGSKYIADPIDETKRCRVRTVSSYGSYIYQRPSKYDRVFYPYTGSVGIWHCKASGFTSLYKDTKITLAEKKEIKQYLDANYKNKMAGYRPSQLQLLEDIYKLRDKSAHFNNKLLRILANHYKSTKSDEYRKLAYDQIVNDLKQELPNKQKIEYTYLAAHYAKKFADKETTEAYVYLLDTIIEDPSLDQDDKSFAKYLKKLLD